MIDREKLIKVLSMTTSSSDGEALAAIRKANKILTENNTTWNNFIRGIPTPRPVSRPSAPMGRGTSNAPRDFTKIYDDPEIPNMIEALRRDAKGSFLGFVESISCQWHDKGYLTKAQYEAVINAFERAK